MNYKKNCFPLLFFLLFSFVAKSQVIADIRTEARTAFLIDADESQTHYQGIMNDLNDSTGKFGDVDYPSVVDDPLEYQFNEKHLKYLVELTQVRALKKDGSSDFNGISLTILETKIVAGLNWWYQTIPYYDAVAKTPDVGWWSNEIGKQRELEKISVLFYDYLDANNPLLTTPGTTTAAPIDVPLWYTPADIAALPCTTNNKICYLKNAISADFQKTIGDIGDDDNHTGANKADVAGSIIAKGLLENDQTYIDTGKMYMECVMNFATNDNTATSQKFDGVREDYSFNQHNKENDAGDRRAFLYSGGYGMTFMHNVAVWGKAFTGDSGYDYTPEAKQNFFNYILDGYRWMVVGNMTDYSANGRDIAKKYPSSNYRISDDDMSLIMQMAANSGAATALGMMQSQLGGKQTFVETQHKYFWISDYVCHQNDSYFSSLRMCSDRTLGTETNPTSEDQNKLGFWLPYGCTFFYQTGDEYIRHISGSTTNSDNYENIFPFWDWSYVPGVTCPVLDEDDDELLPGLNDHDENPNTQEEVFVGNTSNDKYGVSAMSLDKDYEGGTVSGKKAWFHFGEEVIALGVDFSADDPLHTTVNQCLLDGGVASSSGTVSEGNSQTISSGYAAHDGIAYIFPTDATYFPTGQNVTISNETADSDWDDWYRIDKKSDDVFGLRKVFRT